MTGAIPPSSWSTTKRAVCLEIPDSIEWVALVTGIIQQLSFGYYWDKSYTNWQSAREAGLQILLSWMEQIRCDAGAIPVLEPQCVDYPNNSPMLDWQPANPFLDPSRIPPGYIAQPWGVVGSPPVLTYQPGDVISGLFGLPVLTPALNQGLARVRIKFSGTGTVEVHLIKVIAGGVALLTWDGNPFTATFVDVSMDVLALPPESSDTDIQEVTFETPGDHYIDVTMLPRFSAEAGFAGYGGGIRKVVLCGPDLLAIDRPPESGIVDEFPGPLAPGGGETVAICDVLRWNNGALEVWCCNEWQAVPSIGTGAPGIPTQPPPSAPPPSGECIQYNVSLNGADKWLLPFPLSAGATIQIISPVGGWNDGSSAWFCPTGQVYILGACGADSPAVGGDPLPTGANHMQLVGEIAGGTGFFNPLLGTYTVPVGVTNEQLTFQANDATLGDNQGTVQFIVRVCNVSVSTWAHCWLGGKGNAGLILPPTVDLYGSYDYGTDMVVTQHNPAAGASAEWGSFTIPFTGDITSVEFDYNYNNDGPAAEAGLATDANLPQVQNLQHNVDVPAGTGVYHFSWTGVQHIATALHVFVDAYSAAHTHGTVTNLRINGEGIRPFGADNC